MRIDLFIHSDYDKKQDEILALLRTIIQKEDQMSAELDALEAQVTENTTVEASAITLIQGIAAQLAAAAQDPAKVKALSASLKASSDSLAAAIAANTPAAAPSA